MNKRQWKKKYKKTYGYNPPTTRKVNTLMDSLAKIIEDLARKYIEIVGKLSQIIKNDIEHGIEQIQNMPKEEFEKMLQEFTIEQRSIAIKIREKKDLYSKRLDVYSGEKKGSCCNCEY